MSSTYLPPDLGENVHEVFTQMCKQPSICSQSTCGVSGKIGTIRRMSTLSMS